MIFALLLVIISVNALKPGISVAISNKVITDLKNNILPIINKQMDSIHIPD